ncbi:hypothetical protein [Pyruvatibacter mobilis]|uniref:hypothetical protein n=1 Tax=Pyruvatibacter mobilis TaxID=1712261 RepID=UPI003C7A0E47
MDSYHLYLVLFGWLILLATVTGHAAARAEEHRHICAFKEAHGWANVEHEGPAAPEANAVISRMAEAVGIRQNFVVTAGDFTVSWRAFAALRNGRRHIVYDRKDFSWADGTASYSDLGIMAHEVGHHLAAHTYSSEFPAHERELEADHFAGFILAKFGAGIVESQEMFKGEWPASKTHPGSKDRRSAVRRGWLSARTEILRQASMCTARIEARDIVVEGRSCILVQTCEAKKPRVRFACRENNGDFEFVDP